MHDVLTLGELQSMAELWAGRYWLKLRKLRPLAVKVPAVVLNNRLKSTAGRAWYEEDKIDLSVELFREHTHWMLTDVIPHELCHMAAWRWHKHSGHGPAWKDTMRAIGLEPKRTHDMVNTLHEARRAKAL